MKGFRVTINDPEILKSIQPRQAAEYLKRKGWTQTEQIEDKASVWKWGKNEVLLLHDKSLGDYVIRMGELLQVLEKVEGRSQLEILEDIKQEEDQEKPTIDGKEYTPIPSFTNLWEMFEYIHREMKKPEPNHDQLRILKKYLQDTGVDDVRLRRIEDDYYVWKGDG